MTPAAERSEIRLERTFAASPERLFRAWTAPRELERFAWGSLGRDARAEIDLRVGGRFSVSTACADGKRWTFSGEYTAIEPGRRLAHTLVWDAPMGYDDARETLDLEFAPDGDETKVVFRHEGDFGAEARGLHAEGWENVLDTLAAHLGERRPPA